MEASSKDLVQMHTSKRRTPKLYTSTLKRRYDENELFLKTKLFHEVFFQLRKAFDFANSECHGLHWCECKMLTQNLFKKYPLGLIICECL